MSSKPIAVRPLVVAVLLGAIGSANATLTVYTSSAGFLAAASSVGTDTFAGFSLIGTTPSPIVRSAGPYTYTGTATGGFFGGGTSGDPFLSTNLALDSMAFGSFSGGVSAIGGNFFTSNISGLYAPGSITVSVTDSFGATASQTISPAGILTGSYLGFTSNGTITGMTVTAVQPATPIWPSVDNLALGIAVAVPEPGTYAMLLAGIAVLGFIAHRRG